MLQGKVNVPLVFDQRFFQGLAQPPVMKGDGCRDYLLSLFLADYESVHIQLEFRRSFVKLDNFLHSLECVFFPHSS
jgi:hypothetical protein